VPSRPKRERSVEVPVAHRHAAAWNRERHASETGQASGAKTRATFIATRSPPIVT
jgi:hypothetical protein